MLAPPDLFGRRPASVRSPSTLEDRKTAWAYDEPENDQYRAEDDVARNEQDDPHDDEDYGDEPPDETHGSLLPTPSSSHTLAVGLARSHDVAAGSPSRRSMAWRARSSLSGIRCV
jgi:hypothetical protein